MKLDCEVYSVPIAFGAYALAHGAYLRLRRELLQYRDDTKFSKLARKGSIRKKYSSKSAAKEVDTIVIGSGMGGLSCAAILSRAGHKVLVLEKHNDVAGGGTHQFDLKGYTFDSGLHYTVPWSVPIFALTCLKPEKEVCPFELIGDKDATIDKIFFCDAKNASAPIKSFDMKHDEAHIKQLYADFPNDKAALDKFFKISDNALLYVKVFLFARLLPRWLQSLYWSLVPSSITSTASQTAEQILPTLTSNKRLISLLSSMWIDTGARPDTASFMMTASVFRGIAMEGGSYPALGTESMAVELVETINRNGGEVLIRADVKQILVEGGRAAGVRMEDGTVIRARRGVVSSAGYVNTFGKLVDESVLRQFNIPKELKVKQSAGFVMANIGLKGSAVDMDITATNSWHIPITPEGDAFKPMKEFFADPLSGSPADLRAPTFITFPSEKEKGYAAAHPGKVSCQMLIMAPYEWFEGLVDDTQAYLAVKKQWEERALAVLHRYYPKTKGHEDLVDISTPVTIGRWLNAHQGAAVGLDVTPERFTDAETRRRLDPVTDIPGLYLTGQDTSVIGVTLAQLSGITTAFRIAGLCTAVRMVAASVLQGILAQ